MQTIKNDRNNIRRGLPRNISIENVSGTFSLIEVVADGRCFFGSFWLLSLTPQEIRTYMTDPEGYEAMDNFVDNELSNFIKNEIFAKASKCQKMTMMRTHYVDNAVISEAMAGIFKVDRKGDSALMDQICSSNGANLGPPLVKEINVAYEQLTRKGFVREFDKYLMSYYQNNNGTDIYTEADPFLLGNFMSDLFKVNMNIVKNPPENLSIFAIDSTFTGTNGPEGKEDIYIYFRSGHFQPMIRNSIFLDRDKPIPMRQTLPNVSSSKRKTQAPDENTPIESLKNSFQTLDENTITQVYDVNNKNYTNADHQLAVMEEPEANPYAHKVDAKKSLDTGQSHGNRDARSFDSEDSSTYFNFDENSGIQSNEETLRTEVANCLTEKKSLSDYFTFPKRLKIKYVSPGKKAPTDLPSTGTWGSFRGKTSTTDRIQPWGEDKPDSVYSKMNEKFTNPDIQTVEIFNGDGNIQTPEAYKNATENWYFLVTLGSDPSPKGGRTRKKGHKGGRMRSHKKIKMRIRGRQSQTKRRKSKKSFLKYGRNHNKV